MNDKPHSSGDLPEKTGQKETADPSAGGIRSGEETVFTELTDSVIKRELRKLFRVSLRTDDFSETNQDALELLSEVRVRLLTRFSSLKNDDQGLEVENLAAYARAAAGNAFRDYLRKKYPARLRLSNRIRYILNVSEGLDSWKSEDGELLCGKVGWRGTETAGTGDLPEEIVAVLSESDGASTGRSGGERVRSLLFEFFDLSLAPVPLLLLVSTLAEVLKLNEPSMEVPEEGVSELKDRSRSVVRRFEDRLSLAGLWRDILELPVRHRTAVLLNLRTDNGDNALPLFVTLQVASARDLADALSITVEELSGIWEHLPLDDNTIGERLGLTRQQVINLRSSARANLRRKRD